MSLLTEIKSRVSEHSEKNKREAAKQNKEAEYMLKLYSQNGDIQYIVKAIDIYSDLIKYYSDFIPAYLSLAYISWEMNSSNEAISLIKKAIELDPYNKNAQKMLSEYTEQLKTKSIAKFSNNKKIDNDFTKNLKEKVVKNKKPGKGFFSMMLSIFSSSPKPKKNTKLSKTNDDSFAQMLSQTSKIMGDNKTTPVIARKANFHLGDKK